MFQENQIETKGKKKNCSTESYKLETAQLQCLSLCNRD